MKERLIEDIKKAFQSRIDQRWNLIANGDTIAGVVESIALRSAKDAVSLVCQIMMAVVIYPDLAKVRNGIDMIVYSIDGIDDDGFAIDLYEHMSKEERRGVVLWLEWARHEEFGKICKREVESAIELWSKMNPRANQ